jgi:hypothetical protein
MIVHPSRCVSAIQSLDALSFFIGSFFIPAIAA